MTTNPKHISSPGLHVEGRLALTETEKARRVRAYTQTGHKTLATSKY